MVRYLALVLLVVACESDKKKPPAPAKATKHAPVVGRTGATELLPADGAPMLPMPIADYQREMAGKTSVVVATKFPENLSKTAGAGVNLRAVDKNVSWVIDGDPSRGFWLAYDENANGDLTDDTRRELLLRDGAWELSFSMQVEGLFSGEAVATPVRIRLRPDKGEMRVQQAIVRRGTLALPTGPMDFALIGDSGQFGLDHQFVAFDLDRDGKLDLETLDNPELFHVFEKGVTLDDTSYMITFDITGDSITLTPLPKRLPPRPTLAAGTTAPPIEVTDFDGKPASLAALKGKVVLVDFWATSCAPCVKALPRLAELRAEHHARGFELMSIAMDTPDVAEVLGAHRAGIAAVGDAVQTAWRVDRYPMYFLIARDGTIACSRCQLDKIEGMLAAELAKKS